MLGILRYDTSTCAEERRRQFVTIITTFFLLLLFTIIMSVNNIVIDLVLAEVNNCGMKFEF